MEKFKIFIRELGNVCTNLLTPLFALICAIMELFHAPAEAIEKVKKIEYWAFYALATAEDIRKITEGKSTDDQGDKDDQDTNE